MDDPKPRLDDSELQALLADAYDDAKLCRIFAFKHEPPLYDAALECIEVVIGHLEDALDELDARLDDQNANPS